MVDVPVYGYGSVDATNYIWDSIPQNVQQASTSGVAAWSTSNGTIIQLSQGTDEDEPYCRATRIASGAWAMTVDRYAIAIPIGTYDIYMDIRLSEDGDEQGVTLSFRNNTGTTILYPVNIVLPADGQWHTYKATVNITSNYAGGSQLLGYTLRSSSSSDIIGTIDTKNAYVMTAGVAPFTGATPNTANFTDGTGYRYDWTGVAGASQSTRTPLVLVGHKIIPIRNLSTQEVLYGDRTTSYRWEVLTHDNGVDNLVGTLDGVTDGSLSWTQNVAVKGGGKAEVADLDVAKPGLLRIADLPLESVRLRPVCVIEGLPENPLGTYLVSNASEQWEATGRVWALELLDRCTVLDQDAVEESYSVAAGTVVLQEIRTILASAGEYIAIDESSTLATSSGMVWDVGTSKLKIVNDLLDVINYNALWIDGYGNFQTTPRVLPADRDLNYELLGIPRELQDGEQSIYSPSWTRDKDSFSVPNKVIAVQSAGADDEAALVGEWTNTDPTSPYSYPARGRWITYVVTDVDVPDGTDAEKVAYLQSRAQTTLVQMSAVQAQVKVTHLPIPVRVGDVLRFANSTAGLDGRHTITKTQLDLNSLGLMQSQLQEVISL